MANKKTQKATQKGLKILYTKTADGRYEPYCTIDTLHRENDLAVREGSIAVVYSTSSNSQATRYTKSELDYSLEYLAILLATYTLSDKLARFISSNNRYDLKGGGIEKEFSELENEQLEKAFSVINSIAPPFMHIQSKSLTEVIESAVLGFLSEEEIISNDYDFAVKRLYSKVIKLLVNNSQSGLTIKNRK